VPQMVAVTADLVVEGTDDAGGVGTFRGRVVALAIDDRRGGIPPTPAETWLLVVDENRPTPVWVPQTAVNGQRLGR
jgi:hypothetical protein